MSLTYPDENAPLIKQQQKNKKKLFATYVRSTSLSGSFEADSSEDVIRQKLQWYFKNPYEKYKERKRKPVKLFLQIIKIILVTVQVCLFTFLFFTSIQKNDYNYFFCKFLGILNRISVFKILKHGLVKFFQKYYLICYIIWFASKLKYQKYLSKGCLTY